MSGEQHARVLRETSRLLRAGVAGHVFPGGVACIGTREGDRSEYVEAVGGQLAPGATKVTSETVYDLASLTKSFVATAALRMWTDGDLDLDMRADRILTEIRGGVANGATLEQLFTHRSGLVAWGGFYLDVPHDPGSGAARRWIMSEAAHRMQDVRVPMVYSDLGYMLAGEALARIAGEPLDVVVRHWVLEPLGLENAVYYAGSLHAGKRSRVAKIAAPTEKCEWRDRVLQGEVHDENCAALGGVSGHAGLFGTARAVAEFGRALLEGFAGRSDFLDAERLQYALKERPGGTYRFGFDTKAGDRSAAGKRMGDRTFGHLGFTGTSFWCDPDRDAVVVLLTNRVFPSRANLKIRGFRPAFHDGVIAALE